jgi:AraC family transcriptional regulator of adaptative response/methylated-DNA-[protein]-cysteine methyltransferase
VRRRGSRGAGRAASRRAGAPANGAGRAGAPATPELPGIAPANAGRSLPPVETMLRAVAERDRSFEGIFFAGVTTTGVFCRPGCPARTPRPEHIVFFPSAGAALEAGFRACRRCRPFESTGRAPDWLRPLLAEIDADPRRRFKDADLVERGLAPERVRRWFRAQHGITFQTYQRARRLGEAMGELRAGRDLLATGLDVGYESASGFAAALARITGASPGASRATERILVDRIETPLGTMVAAGTERALWLLEFTDRRMLATQLARVAARSGAALVPGSCPPVERIREELAAYFAGSLRRFRTKLELAGTPFQEAVWGELARIPYGETRSYGELAAAVGRPAAVRAVGRANGENPLAIIIPCHRVIGADGSLTGYGGGVWRKRRLLEIEGAS